MASLAVGTVLASVACVGLVTPRLAVVVEGASRVFAERGRHMKLVTDSDAFTHQAVCLPPV